MDSTGGNAGGSRGYLNIVIVLGGLIDSMAGQSVTSKYK